MLKRNYMYVLAVLLTITYVIFARLDFLLPYFQSQYIGGWDTATHFGFLKYYSTNIFPGMFDWVPTWYSGMPFPQFYPPFFFYIYSLVDHFIFPITTQTFKVLQIFTYLITPIILGLLYYFGYKQDKKKATLVTVFSFLISMLPVMMAERGFGFAATLKTGLITQAFSFPMLLAWMYFTYKIHDKKIHQVWSTFLLVLLLLTNIHSAFTCIFLYLFFYIKDIYNKLQEKDSTFWLTAFECIRVYLINGAFAVLMVSFWYIPMIYYFDFSTARPLDFPFADKNWFMLRQSYQLLIPLFLLWFKIKNKKYDLAYVLSLFSVLTYLLNLINIKGLVDFPFHSERMLGAAFLFFPILLIEAFYLVSKHNKKLGTVVMAATGIILIFFNYSLSDHMQSYGLFENNKSVEHILAESYKSPSGLFTVEPASSLESVDALINTELGLHGIRTTYSILRESSISSIFFIGIRNSFSEIPEYWSIRSRLATSQDYLLRDLTSKIHDAIKYGITNILVKTPTMKDLLDTSKDARITKVGTFDDWSMYKLNSTSTVENSDIEILPNKPVLVVSAFDAKNYNLRSLDYISIAEEMLRVSSFDARFVYADKKDLDKVNYNDFSFVLLEDAYLMDNPAILTKLVDKQLSQKILVPNKAVDMALYRNIKNIIPYESPRNASDRAGYIQFFIQFVKDNLVQTDVSTLKDVHFNDLGKMYTLQNSSEKPISLIIKRSYFPTWKSDTQNMYMINPSYIYVNLAPRTSTTLYFSYPPVFWYSNILSLISILGFGAYALFLLRTKKHS